MTDNVLGIACVVLFFATLFFCLEWDLNRLMLKLAEDERDDYRQKWFDEMDRARKATHDAARYRARLDAVNAAMRKDLP